MPAFALQVTGSRLVALTAAPVLCLDLATIRIANLLLTETISTLLITLVAWTIYRAITKSGSDILLQRYSWPDRWVRRTRASGEHPLFVPLSFACFSR